MVVCQWWSVAALAFPTLALPRYQTSGGPRDGVVNVHLVPHTHDDAGWLKTVDEYYAGQNTSIQHAGVHYILDSVIRRLDENPDRTFVYVEQAFFQRWWRQQNDNIRSLVRRLVKNGQLQMINGAWVMHCEATPHYLDMIDQTRLGHKFLMEEFGVLPKIGWQIDPFGHSATQAALLSAEVGFTGLFFGRIDYQDLKLRVDHSEAEFIWRASPSLGPDVQVFSGLTGSYGGNYGPPSGFCWDLLCSDEPIQDDPDLEDYNVKSRIDDFVKASLWQANHTRGNHILMTMGSDFQYEAAGDWYSNLDKLIHYLNQDGRVNAFYSDMEKYMAAKAKENVTWPLKTDDFFPYADGAHQFWTGYFTSRPDLKRFVRDSSAFFQISKQLLALGLPSKLFAELEPLAEAMGLLQHHDAVAGTEKQHAAFDYAKRLARARTEAEAVDSHALASLLGDDKLAFTYCVERNVSICTATQKASANGQALGFIVWNGLAQERTELVEIPIEAAVSVVEAQTNDKVPSQVVDSLPSITDYGAQANGAKLTLLFEAKLPAMGFKAYQLQPQHLESRKTSLVQEDGDAVLENEHLKVTICDSSGRLCSITDKESGVTAKAVQDWYWYRGSVGNDESGQASGAYIFRPNASVAEQVFKARPTVKVSRGELADEVVQEFGSVVYQRLRLAKGARHLEITYTVKDISIADGWGKELVSRISTDIGNSGECYTDSNGREMIPRKKDYRPTWKLKQTEPAAGNYFPVGTAVAIRDSKAQLTVLTDAVQAGTGCVTDGEIELMVDRRLLKDDGRGVGEPLNETQFVKSYAGDNGGQHYGPKLVVRGQHFVVFAPPAKSAAVWRPLQDRVYIKTAPFFANSPMSAKAASYSALSATLPVNVQIVTMETMGANAVLLRLAHQFGLGEDAELSKLATVDIASLFAGRSVVSVEELALTGTAPRSEVLKRRIAWKIDGDARRTPMDQAGDAALTTGSVVLGPLQIKTFRVSFAADDITMYV